VELLDLESLIKLGVATLLGGLVGLERELHGRPAGLRTNALVCMAAALLIVVSRSGALEGIGGSGVVNLNVDPARMAAGIVTGIGFLGAGAILRIRESLVRGLTTAATIWFVAAIGIAVGLGEWSISIAATTAALVLLFVFGRMERFIGSIKYRALRVETDLASRERVEESCRGIISRNDITIQQSDYLLDNEGGTCSMRFALRTRHGRRVGDVVGEMARIEGVRSVKIS